METKTCPRCEETKDVSEFGKNTTRPDGLQFYCKVCSAAAQKASEQKRKGVTATPPAASATQPEPVKGTVHDKVRESQRLNELALATRNWAIKIEATGTKNQHGYFTVRDWCQRFDANERTWQQVKRHMMKLGYSLVWDDGIGHYLGEDGEQAKTLAVLANRMAAYGETLYYMLEAAKESGEWETMLPQLQDKLKSSRHPLRLDHMLQLMQGSGLKIGTSMERLLLPSQATD